MEEEVHKQTEREELLREIAELEKEAKKHESQLADLDVQQRQMLENVRRDTAKLESERQKVIQNLERETQTLQTIELKIKDLAKQQQLQPGGQHQHLDMAKKIDQDPESSDSDSGNEDEAAERNLELDRDLKRLALLDKTQEEIEKLSMAVVKLKEQQTNGGSNYKSQLMMPTKPFGGSPLLVLQQQKQIAEELNRVIRAMNNKGDGKVTTTKHLVINGGGANSLNSAGSEEESVGTIEESTSER